MSSSSQQVIKFLPFSSTVDSPFWVQYCHLKLETIRLSEEPLEIVASFTPNDETNRLQCQEASLQPATSSSTASTNIRIVPNDRVACHGTLLGHNTLESFTKVDKNQLLKDLFVPEFMESKENTIAALTRFVLLTFADLKNHKVLYWFGFPALLTQSPIQADVMDLNSPSFKSLPSSIALAEKFHSLRQDCVNKGYHGLPPFFVCTDNRNGEDLRMELLSRDVLSTKFHNVGPEHLIFGFLNPPSPSIGEGQQPESSPIMGWTLRNLIAYLVFHLDMGGQKVTFVRFHTKARRLSETNATVLVDPSSSALYFQVILPAKMDYQFDKEDETSYKVVGWELNARHKPGPRWVNLKPLLDSTHLAIQAADLNLKLMKWRMLPSLQVDLLQSTKVLLVGAGTLGCSVARTLLGWGIRHYTILDYGTVGYSNPVRQNLFTLEDCHFNNGAGKPKAEAAAQALGLIAADVLAQGVHLSIPMPGHCETKESIAASVTALDKLVQDCDVVFLLTDTRESRWLPTIMAAAHDKILINAALGLDSWLVMRHGGGGIACGDEPAQPRLGCYFCNDVVAPENSTKNRTLDQQCTVTRPGLAPIAASVAVELMVSLLHHPQKQRAPAPAYSSKEFSPTSSSSSASSALGVIPHQIRGSLVSYTMMTPTVPAFACCTGCSFKTIEAYQKDNLELTYEVCQSTDGAFLEELSGLTAFRAEAAEKMAGMEDWEDDE